MAGFSGPNSDLLYDWLISKTQALHSLVSSWFHPPPRRRWETLVLPHAASVPAYGRACPRRSFFSLFLFSSSAHQLLPVALVAVRVSDPGSQKNHETSAIAPRASAPTAEEPRDAALVVMGSSVALYVIPSHVELKSHVTSNNINTNPSMAHSM